MRAGGPDNYTHIDIHLSNAGPWSVVAIGTRVVVHQRHHYASVAQLVLDILHVVAIWEDDAIYCNSILILDLDKDDWAGFACQRRG